MNNQDILTKRFQTTMIGALFEFEKYFGHIWGLHKNDDEPLTQSEEEYRELWEDVRNQILNNGNNQLRKCIADLRPNVQYHYKFYKKGQDYDN
jgi:hypothetical protein